MALCLIVETVYPITHLMFDCPSSILGIYRIKESVKTQEQPQNHHTSSTSFLGRKPFPFPSVTTLSISTPTPVELFPHHQQTTPHDTTHPSFQKSLYLQRKIGKEYTI